MEHQNPSFSFALQYVTELVVCDVVMQEREYDVFFNGRYMASIAHTEDWTWMQSAGAVLPGSIIEEIGLKVESEYK